MASARTFDKGAVKLGKGTIYVVGETTFTYDPASLVDAAGESLGTATVAGALFGDYVMVAAPYDLQGITVTAWVSAANTVTLRVQNETGGTINLASGSWKVKVVR